MYYEIKRGRKSYTSFDLGLSYLPCFILFLDSFEMIFFVKNLYLLYQTKQFEYNIHFLFVKIQLLKHS